MVKFWHCDAVKISWGVSSCVPKSEGSNNVRVRLSMYYYRWTDNIEG